MAAVQPGEGPGVALARRLKWLRQHRWPGRPITQPQLAAALGSAQKLSVPSISSWESLRDPVAPPQRRLEAYALFFATERSVAGGRYRLLNLDDLEPDERAERDELLGELLDLRRRAQSGGEPLGPPGPAPSEAPRGRLWNFPSNQDITIVVAELPKDMRGNTPLTDPTSPDYVEMYTYADLDSLVELHGHIRATCPANQVNIRTAIDVRTDDYTSHLVLLGGVDWNKLTSGVFRELDLPVSQVARVEEQDPGGFEVVVDGKQKVFSPVVETLGGRQNLIEDVAHFYRGPNPYNQRRTVTVFNGMYGRGTYGAVRALTDARFRDRNEQHLIDRLAEDEAISVITRVRILNGQASTPDWTDQGDDRLHEWPEDR
jgi:hypothetical protein